jgi:hypothetical protein
MTSTWYELTYYMDKVRYKENFYESEYGATRMKIRLRMDDVSWRGATNIQANKITSEPFRI